MQKLTKVLIGAAAMLSLSAWGQAPIVDAQAGSSSQYSQGPAAQTRSGSPASDMYTQMQQLQNEVMELRGKVEEQAFQIQKLKQQSLDRYIELDRRIGALQGGASSKPASVPVRPSSPTPSSTGSRSETSDYRAAYNLVKAQKFADAIPAFKDFIAAYPASRYAPNAWYWLGELYLVNSPQNLSASAEAFSQLLEKHPDNSKVSDAMYKLGKVKYLQGETAASKQLLERVVAEHPDSSAAKLAAEFLRQSF